MRITLELIHQEFMKYFNIDKNYINQKNRSIEIKIIRQLAHYLAKKYTSNTLDSIAFYFGRLNHATAINSCKKIQNLIDTNDEIVKNDYNYLDDRIQKLKDGEVKTIEQDLKEHTAKIVKDLSDNIKIYQKYETQETK